MIVGGMLGVKMDKKAMMNSSTNSSDVNPRMHESMVIILLRVSEKIVAT